MYVNHFILNKENKNENTYCRTICLAFKYGTALLVIVIVIPFYQFKILAIWMEASTCSVGNRNAMATKCMHLNFVHRRCFFFLSVTKWILWSQAHVDFGMEGLWVVICSFLCKSVKTIFLSYKRNAVPPLKFQGSTTRFVSYVCIAPFFKI